MKSYVDDKFDMERIETLAALYWAQHGRAPTHLIITPEYQQMLTDEFSPNQRINAGSSEGLPKAQVTSVVIKNSCTIDLVCIVPMRTGNNHFNFIKPFLTELG